MPKLGPVGHAARLIYHLADVLAWIAKKNISNAGVFDIFVAPYGGFEDFFRFLQYNGFFCYFCL